MNQRRHLGTVHWQLSLDTSVTQYSRAQATGSKIRWTWIEIHPKLLLFERHKLQSEFTLS